VQQASLSERDFARFRQFIFDAAGITLSPAKKALVCGRLARRLAARGLDSYGRYLDLLEGGEPASEVQIAVDLLTTNETYFFREPRHFDLLRTLAGQAKARRRRLRAWSAACSSGEEPYSIAMVLDDVLGEQPWEVTGSDISSRVLQRARTGHYVDDRARLIPADYLKRYCLRGTDEYAGTLLVDRALRRRVSFMQMNLNEDLPAIGPFDIIFLRNVMIYFSPETKRAVVERVLERLEPGGHFCIGHSETLHGIGVAVEQVAPSVYRKP
jgi:chemotaxis protein methyltransferase CheR